jgi:heme/copper-type cytochrome/quinol oxidase subunit 2
MFVRRATAVFVRGTVVLAVLGAAAGAGPPRVEPRPPQAVTIEITAQRFAFLPAKVEVVEGDQVTLAVTSADGTHGFEIKTLEVKKEVPRGGAVVTLSFTAPAPGTYEIKCSEYCGRGHKDMKAALVVSPRGQ